MVLLFCCCCFVDTVVLVGSSSHTAPDWGASPACSVLNNSQDVFVQTHMRMYVYMCVLIVIRGSGSAQQELEEGRAEVMETECSWMKFSNITF